MSFDFDFLHVFCLYLVVGIWHVNWNRFRIVKGCELNASSLAVAGATGLKSYLII